MNKQLTFILSLTFLFLFSGSGYGEVSQKVKVYINLGLVFSSWLFIAVFIVYGIRWIVQQPKNSTIKKLFKSTIFSTFLLTLSFLFLFSGSVYLPIISCIFIAAYIVYYIRWIFLEQQKNSAIKKVFQLLIVLIFPFVIGVITYLAVVIRYDPIHEMSKLIEIGGLRSIVEGRFGEKDYYRYSGKLKSDTTYKNGKKEGIQTFFHDSGKWYETGKKMGEVFWKNGKREGIATWWFESGSRERKIHYKNGNQDGLETRWFESGLKEWEIHYKNGKQDGLETVWYESGKKKGEVPYKDWFKEGLGIIWFESGKKKGEVPYKNGDKEGLGIRWYENGEKEYELLYKEGIREGLKTGWYESGNKKYELPFKNGNKNGLEITWHENGNKRSEVLWENGKQEGLETTWNESGDKEEEGSASNPQGNAGGDSLADVGAGSKYDVEADTYKNGKVKNQYDNDGDGNSSSLSPLIKNVQTGFRVVLAMNIDKSMLLPIENDSKKYGMTPSIINESGQWVLFLGPYPTQEEAIKMVNYIQKFDIKRK